MKNINFKVILLKYIPYVAVAFIVLLPSLGQAIRVNSYSILYVIYFFLIINLLSVLPFRKFFSFLLLLIFSPLFIYRVINKKYIGLDDITSIFDSNLPESVDFILSSNNYFLVLFPIIISVTFVFVFELKQTNKIVSGVCFLLSVLSLYAYEYHYENISLKYPVKIYKDYLLYENEIKRISDGYKKIYNEKIYSTTNPIKIYLVIGESSRKDYYSICSSYNKNATPKLKKISKRHNFISFCNAKSVALNTRYSVTSMLSSQAITNFSNIQKYANIIHVFNNYGLETNVFENNARPEQKNNIHKTLILSNFIPANSIYFSKNKYDFGFFKQVFPLIGSKNSTLNIIHMKGNHMKYIKTYPKYFLNNIKETYYYKSIRYTDISLSYLIDEVNSSNDNSLLLYLSDHGEYVNDFLDNKFGHGVITLRRYDNKKEVLDYLTDIPFFIYVNNKFITNYPNTYKNLIKNKDKRISQDNIFSTLVGVIDSKDNKESDLYNASYDLSSNKFIENPRFIYNSDVNYNILDTDAFIRVDN